MDQVYGGAEPNFEPPSHVPRVSGTCHVMYRGVAARHHSHTYNIKSSHTMTIAHIITNNPAQFNKIIEKKNVYIPVSRNLGSQHKTSFSLRSWAELYTLPFNTQFCGVAASVHSLLLCPRGRGICVPNSITACYKLPFFACKKSFRAYV